MTAVPVVVISPHLDDGVLSCGQLLHHRPGSTVVTVFAGMPHRWVTTPYDRGCGFESSAQAIRVRRGEDRGACRLLDAGTVHLDWLDGQYRADAVDPRALSVDLREAVIDGDNEPAVFAPLGLGHPDHVAVSDAALAAGFVGLWLYEELPTRVRVPETVPARIGDLAHAGIKLELTDRCVGDVTAKQAACRCYQSQVHPDGDLNNEHSWLVPERYWRVLR